MESSPPELKHSGLAIASFVTSVVSGVAIFLVIVIAGVLETSTPGGMDDDSAGTMIIGLLAIFFILTAIVALGLGIAGILQRDRRKVFAILGVTFAAVEIIGTLFVIWVGLSME